MVSYPVFAFTSAYRPNSTSRVFSGWSVKPYFANLFGKTSITFSASSLYWKHSTASSAKRISCAAPLTAGLHFVLEPFVEHAV